MLELAIWKSKITEQHDGPNDLLTTEEMQVQCRVDSISMVMILVPNVMTYLFDKIKVYAKIPILFTPPSLHMNTILLDFVQLLYGKIHWLEYCIRRAIVSCYYHRQ